MHRVLRRDLLPLLTRTSHVHSTRNLSAFAPTSLNVRERRIFAIHGTWLKSSLSTDQTSIKLRPSFKPTATKTSAANELDEIPFDVKDLVVAYQTHGHFRAQVNPLGYSTATLAKPMTEELDAVLSNFSQDEVDRVVSHPKNTYVASGKSHLPVRELISSLERAYCGTIGAEFMHLTNPAEIDWFRRKMELDRPTVLDKNGRIRMMHGLIDAFVFEEFMNKKYPADKLFGLEGAEALIPCIETMIEKVSERGMKMVFLGMPHRGRLNVMVNILGMPMEDVIALYDDQLEFPKALSGDTNYHFRYTCQRRVSRMDKKMEITITNNPSHLESVTPVVLGMTRAAQFARHDMHGDRAMSILVHGDSAFTGQGVVYEMIQLSALANYSVGGTIHVVINNQIGFTTDPDVSRSSAYCTDVSKVTNIPVFHVNADDPEAVVLVASLAVEWRMKFRKDIIIDLVCYRRLGHNEGDPPEFTQPLMCRKIANHEPVYKQYAAQLLKDKLVGEIQALDEIEQFRGFYNAAFEKAKHMRHLVKPFWPEEYQDEAMTKLRATPFEMPDTGVSENILNKIGEVYSTVPHEIKVHKRLSSSMMQRRELLKVRKANWALAEAFAFASLLKDGVHVRLSGQDVERGTFSQRHHVMHDQNGAHERVSVLNEIFPGHAEYTVTNSSLSEYAVLGFEFGYTLINKRALVCWEAQFGDFVNNAQVIIDQYISSGEKKWGQNSGIVLLLPHGNEGMGPEHSSARPERFLQGCNDDEDGCPSIAALAEPNYPVHQLLESNWQIVNCSTPANYFHVLRRQVMLPFRKPLVIFTPKSLLRLKEAQSSINDMLPGTRFQRVITDSSIVDTAAVDRLLICSGRIYYDLMKRREKQGLQDTIAIIRVEQLSPFPYDLLRFELRKFPNAKVVWAQEEHKNMGPYSYVKPRLRTLLKRMDDPRSWEIGYVGRGAAAACGHNTNHAQQLERLLVDAMNK